VRVITTIVIAYSMLAACGVPSQGGDVSEGPNADVISDAPSPDAAEVTPLEPLSLWPTGQEPLAWTDWVAERPWLTEVSSWSYGGEVDQEPLAHRRLPDFGVGNGRVFALVGYGRPINTLHSMAGPTYDKHEGFFGDVSLEIRDASGETVSWDEEWAGWVKGAPVVHSGLRAPD